MTDAAIRRASEVVPGPIVSRRGMKRPGLIALIALVGAGAAWYGQHWWTVGRFIESTDDAYVGGDVTVIAPKVSGLVAEVSVTDNQNVRAGQLLVKLDDRDYRAVLAKTEAAVAAADAKIANLAAMRRLQESVVVQAEAGIAAADAQIAVTRADLARYRSLSAESVSSVQTFQRADAAYKQALADGDKTKAVLAAAQQQIAVIDTETQQAKAALAQASAERDLASINLGYTEIRAPIDGTIGARSARVGNYATVGGELLAVVPARGLWVDANFKESQLAEIRPGMPASIEADVLPGKTFHGHVVSLAPATGAVFSVLPPENATGNFTKIVQRVPVRILLDGAASELGVLRPGLSVTARIDERPVTESER